MQWPGAPSAEGMSANCGSAGSAPPAGGEVQPRGAPAPLRITPPHSIGGADMAAGGHRRQRAALVGAACLALLGLASAADVLVLQR